MDPIDDVQVVEVPAVHNCTGECGKYGSCNSTSGKCECLTGYYGETCQYAYVCPFQCHRKGICIANGTCVCNAMFGGYFCEVDYRCPKNCSHRGKCVNAGTECVCDFGYEGDSCERRVSLLIPPIKWKRLFPPEKPSELGIKPPGRHGHVAVPFGDENADSVLMWGGVSEAQAVNDMWVYHAPSAQWHSQQQFGTPSPRTDFAATSMAGALYVFGGYKECDSGASRYSSDLWKYDFETAEWLQLPATLGEGVAAAPTGRIGHTITAVGDSLVVYGGMGPAQTMLYDAWEYRVTAAHWRNLTAPEGGHRRLHSAVPVGPAATQMLVYGGVSASGAVLDTLLNYTVDGGNTTWALVETTNSPGARFRHAAFWREMKLYVFGGQASDSGTFLSDLWVYHPDVKTWEPIKTDGATMYGLVGASAVAIGNIALVVGGLSSTGDLNEVVQHNFAESTWLRRITRGDLPTDRILQSGSVIDGRLWVFGGETVDGHKLNDLWDFHLDFAVWTQHFPVPAGTDKCGTGSGNGTAEEGPSVTWPSRRSAHAATVVASGLGNVRVCGGTEDGLVIFGGQPILEEGTALNDMWIWCPNTQQFSQATSQDAAHRPTRRSHASIVAQAHTLYVFGGLSEGRERLNDMWSCDMQGWNCVAVDTEGNKHPHKRRSMALHLDFHTPVPQLLVFGGYWKDTIPCPGCVGLSVGQGETDSAMDVWKFETQYRRWRKIIGHGAPTGRYCAGSTFLKEKLVVFGGFSSDQLTEFSDLFTFHTEFAQWREIPVEGEKPPGRHEMIFDKYVIIKNEEDFRTYAVVYGGIGSAGAMDDVWMADVSWLAKENWQVKEGKVYNDDQVDHRLATSRKTIVEHTDTLRVKKL